MTTATEPKDKPWQEDLEKVRKAREVAAFRIGTQRFAAMGSTVHDVRSAWNQARQEKP